MLTILIRTVLIYFLLVLLMRITGKRQVGELQLSELVTAFLISEIACGCLSGPEIPLLYSILPAFLLVSLEIAASFLVTRSALFKKMLDGEPSFLIYGGKINQKELSRQRLSIDELLSALRQKNVPDLSGVSYAILEQNGRLSVFCDPNQDKCAFAHSLILDGEVNENALRVMGRDRNWLKKRISAQKCEIGEVFLFTLADDGSEFLVRKETETGK